MIQLRDPYKRKYKDGYLSNEKINDIGDLKYERNKKIQQMIYVHGNCEREID